MNNPFGNGFHHRVFQHGPPEGTGGRPHGVSRENNIRRGDRVPVMELRLRVQNKSN